MIKAALQYLMSLAPNKLEVLNGQTYSEKQLVRIPELSPNAILATTLTSMVDYIKSGYDKKLSENLIIQVVSPIKVELFSELRNDRSREGYFISQALLPSNIQYERFLDSEKFNIMLQSSFVGNEHRDLLLKIAGNLVDEASAEIQDDGVGQATVIKSGIASRIKIIVPNPVILAPYRTFSEICQPESKFIFRLKEGANAGLFEADGGAWRNEAMASIKEYFVEALVEFENIKVIS